MPLGQTGPQRGLFGKRWNPIHTMLATGTDAVAGRQEGLLYADDALNMPIQSATHWDSLGHIFYHDKMYNGHQRDGRRLQRSRQARHRARRGQDLSDAACCSTSPASRASTTLEDGYGISNDDLDACAKAQGVEIRKGDFVLVRTGQMEACQKRGEWGGYAGGDAPGLKFESCYWLQDKQVAGVCSDTWGVEVRPNETKDVNQPWHWVVIPAMGLYMGEMFDAEGAGRGLRQGQGLRVLLQRRAAGHSRRHRLAHQSAGDQVENRAMNLGFFTMPIHPLGKDWRQCLREDREAFILADELGFTEGYVGEHVTDQAENITSCVMFIATLVDATKRIKLGTGTVNLPNAHPAPGRRQHRHARSSARRPLHLRHLPRRAAVGRGDVRQSRRQPQRDVPRGDQSGAGDLDRANRPTICKGKYWTISTERTLLAGDRPGLSCQSPCRRRIRRSSSLPSRPIRRASTEAAARGWDPISANFLMPVWVKSHWPKYVEGCAKAGRPADPANWRVAKSIFVADDDKTARAYVTAANSPYRHYYASLATKLIKNGRAELFKTSRDMPDGTSRSISSATTWSSGARPTRWPTRSWRFARQVGDFGTLLYAGQDWPDRDLARRSMVLAAEKVLPSINQTTAATARAAQ